MTTRISRNRDSLEYVSALVSVEGATLDAQPVEIAVTRGQPTEADWQTAEWQGSPGPSREVRLEPFVPAGDGNWDVFVRITSLPEIPVIKAGRLFLT